MSPVKRSKEGGNEPHDPTPVIGATVKGSVIATLANFSNFFDGGYVMAQETQNQGGSAVQVPPAYRGENQVKPLPFNAGKLKRAVRKADPLTSSKQLSGRREP